MSFRTLRSLPEMAGDRPELGEMGVHLSGGQRRRAMEMAVGTRGWSSQEIQGVEGGRRRGLVQSPGHEEVQQGNWRASSHEGQCEPGKPRKRAVSRRQQKAGRKLYVLKLGDYTVKVLKNRQNIFKDA